MTAAGKLPVVDASCSCAKCIGRTTEMYDLQGCCGNCGAWFTVRNRKGDRSPLSVECPACEVSAYSWRAAKPVAIEAEAREQGRREERERLRSDLRTADEQASVVHDYIWPRAQEPALTREEANDAIWRIHQILRPLFAGPEPSDG